VEAILGDGDNNSRSCLWIVSFALNNSYTTVRRHHACHEGGLDAEEDVIASDDFGADVAVCQDGNDLFGVVFYQVDECSYTKDSGVFEPLGSIQLK
jgi:hypothetical protein